MMNTLYRALTLVAASMAQSTLPAQPIPLQEVEARIGCFLQNAIQAREKEGPNSSFSGWHPFSYSTSLTYRRWLSERIALGAVLGFQRTTFAYEWNPGNGTFYNGHTGGSRNERWVWEAFPLPSIGLDLSVRHAITAKWDLKGAMSAHLTSLRPSSATASLSVRADANPDSSVVIMTRKDLVNERGGSIPFIRISVELARRLPNFNRLSLGAEIQSSTRQDIFTGSYVLHPGTTNESKGRYSGGIGYLGMTLGYAMSWGPPKLPAYIRRAQRKAASAP